MKKAILFIILHTIVYCGFSQEGHPVSWEISSKQIDPQTYKIQLHATIKDPYHIYPQQSSGGGLGMPTQILFEEDENVELVGEITEQGDEQADQESTSHFSKGVTFSQKIRLRSAKKTVLRFRVKYMACTNEMCLPPSLKKFTLILNDEGITASEAEDDKSNAGLSKKEYSLKYFEFTLADTAGKKISSRDIIAKNKYTFIDFWASWCGPCRAQARALLPGYKKYAALGFAIVGVSLDTDKTAWKKAIRDDKYSWTNVSDLMGFESPLIKQYGITAIPRNMLIDDKFNIVATDLHGEALEKKLTELFGR